MHMVVQPELGEFIMQGVLYVVSSQLLAIWGTQSCHLVKETNHVKNMGTHTSTNIAIDSEKIIAVLKNAIRREHA